MTWDDGIPDDELTRRLQKILEARHYLVAAIDGVAEIGSVITCSRDVAATTWPDIPGLQLKVVCETDVKDFFEQYSVIFSGDDLREGLDIGPPPAGIHFYRTICE